MATSQQVRAALIVVDMQEDFCPPSGSLAIEGGRDIVPKINELLDLPGFVLRIATRDYHPRDHISFASQHEDKEVFAEHVINSPENDRESQTMSVKSLLYSIVMTKA
jgi:nicotinamidase-related amidase